MTMHFVLYSVHQTLYVSKGRVTFRRILLVPLLRPDVSALLDRNPLALLVDLVLLLRLLIERLPDGKI